MCLACAKCFYQIKVEWSFYIATPWAASNILLFLEYSILHIMGSNSLSVKSWLDLKFLRGAAHGTLCQRTSRQSKSKHTVRRINTLSLCCLRDRKVTPTQIQTTTQDSHQQKSSWQKKAVLRCLGGRGAVPKPPSQERKRGQALKMGKEMPEFHSG